MVALKPLMQISQHWQHLDGVMMGREAYHNPYVLAQALTFMG
jgi:tRNA-dihydrouridine synthase A